MNYELANLILKSVCPNNAILLDNKNMPSVMVRVPKFKISDLIDGGSEVTHPAFVVNGVEVSEIYVSKFLNVVNDGRAYSMPGVEPKNSINFDTAKSYCDAKGDGWHLMTNAEWSAIALWCRKNNSMPLGNNNFGKDCSEPVHSAIPAAFYSLDRSVTHVLNGTGPVTWAHNGESSGIYDLNGNLAEWVGGLRTVYGEIQVIMNNNAATPNNSQATSSKLWRAIDASTGELIEPDGCGTTPNSIKVDWVDGLWQLCTKIINQDKNYYYCKFEDMKDGGIKVPEILKALAIFPADSGSHGNDRVYFNNGEAERFILRGGYWKYKDDNGMFYMNGDSSRYYEYIQYGFRSVYIPGI